ncbi:protein kinase domain-containing protein [Actinomadura madurae]|uniref:protein kinase domain-containing protein n=2 Tax=Actinomadura madurae TaxID=1993 RepID=UPI0020D25CE8|nr:protein kinase [Actinomadura madurae]MCP9948583.1 serine/threonine-protein kinase [Actinomadura madurae]MCP9965361.1 serine/threonine-protein kinase [Actinomadura madurae]MCP9977848.1 serine/threonine-protein kinase [Actinomadura madurae]
MDATSLRELRPDDPTRIGRYRIEAKIGEGGMGAVYLGRDPEERPVAVKVVRAELAGDKTFLARFHDEAANAQRVASFCTAQVLEHGEDLGLAYMVTEYIDGPSLLQHVSEKGALSPGMLHGVAVGVAAALVAIHSAGLVHRDLKPSNVLLSISGPRVIDFGIARALDMASSHTRTGQVVGTPGWIAPEQITTQQVTPAVDVFAWGCLVAFAASGRNPFGQGSFQLLAARAVHADPEVDDLPAPLAGIVQAALRKDPAQRPSARDLLLALVGGAGEAAVTTELGEAWTSPPAGDPGVTSQDVTAPSPAPPPAPAPAPSTPSPSTPSPSEAAPSEAAPPVSSPPAPSPAAPTAQAPSPPVPAAPAPQPPAPEPEPPTEPAYERRTDPPTERQYVPPVLPGAAARPEGLAVPADHADRLDRGGGADRGRRGGRRLLPQPAVRQRAEHRRRERRVPGRPDVRPRRHGAGLAAGMPWRHRRLQAGRPVRDDARQGLAVRHPARALPRREARRVHPAARPERRGVGDERGRRRRAEGHGHGARHPPDLVAGRHPPGVHGRQGRRPADLHDPLRGGPATQVTRDPSAKDDPMWSSKGRIVFWSKRDSDVEQIYSLDPNDPGGAWTRLTSDGVRAVDPEWSPDGSRVAFVRGEATGSDIWLVDADGSGAHALTSGAVRDMDPAWSRDGRWLAYVRGDVTEPVIHAIRADGEDDRVVTPEGGTLGHPNWS